jgi:hypothetical protein
VSVCVRNELAIALIGDTRKKRDGRRKCRFGVGDDGVMAQEPPDHREGAPYARPERAELVAQALADSRSAGARATFIFRERYVNDRTLDEVAAEVGVTRQRASQLCSRAARYARQGAG